MAESENTAVKATRDQQRSYSSFATAISQNMGATQCTLTISHPLIKLHVFLPSLQSILITIFYYDYGVISPDNHEADGMVSDKITLEEMQQLSSSPWTALCPMAHDLCSRCISPACKMNESSDKCNQEICKKGPANTNSTKSGPS